MKDCDVLRIIFDKKIEKSSITYRNDLIEWYWLVGFRKVEINDSTITCYVDRPNKFIGRFNEEYINFLIYLKNYFNDLGYNFDIVKYEKVEYYEEFKEFLMNSQLI